MPTRRPPAGSRGIPAVFALALLLGASAACNTSGDNVIVNNNLGCGLVRTDLFGTWVVTFTPGTTTLTNCDNVAKNGVAVDVAGAPATYTNVQAIASPSGKVTLTTYTSPRPILSMTSNGVIARVNWYSPAFSRRPSPDSASATRNVR